MNLRTYARGQPCMVRIPGVCNGDPDTTVLAHMNGGGMGTKHPDLLGAWCCSSCHDAVDRRTHVNRLDAEWVRQHHLEGIIRTQLVLIDEGVVKW